MSAAQISNVETLAQLASTTLASYATLRANLAGSLVDPDSGANFTTTQADTFVEQYTLLSQRPNVDLNVSPML